MANRLNVANIGYNDATDALTIDSSGNVTASGTLTPSTLDVSAGTLTLADDQISGDKVEGGTITSTTITSLTTGSISEATADAGVSIDGLTLKDGGIQFRTATGGSGTFSSGTLDDYEEGTFTAEIADANTGGNSNSGVSGKYTKIGNLVNYTISDFNVNTSGLTSSNTLYIRGLPFLSGNLNSYAAVWADTINYDGYLMFGVAANSNHGVFNNIRDNNTDTSVLVSALTNGVSDFYVIGQYFIS